MGVRRVQVDAAFIANCLRDGFRVSEALEPVADACLLEARLAGNPYRVELLIESPTFDGPEAEGRWVEISEGRWDEFPIFIPTFRTMPSQVVVSADTMPGVDELRNGPGLFQPPPEEWPFGDPDDRHSEVSGA